MDAGEIEPSLGTGDRSLKVFGQPAVAIEPSEGPFDHPAAGEHDEAGSVSFDDLDRPAADSCLPGILRRADQPIQARKSIRVVRSARRYGRPSP